MLIGKGRREVGSINKQELMGTLKKWVVVVFKKEEGMMKWDKLRLLNVCEEWKSSQKQDYLTFACLQKEGV